MISVFTPSHDTRWLAECYQSLTAQTYGGDWEWVVLLNGDAAATDWGRDWLQDPRVKVFQARHLRGVGAAKAAACDYAEGTILLELDHDDVLEPTCLAEVADAFRRHPEASLVYSDTAEMEADGTPRRQFFDPAYGWEFDGNVAQCFDPLPHNVSLIWFAPNHVRAFRRDAYLAAGGYDANRQYLDDQDLMARLYLQGPFVHLRKALYKQRVHAANTQSVQATNAAIQVETVQMYGQTIEGALLAWSKRKDLLALDLGAAHNPRPGFQTVDLVEPADYVGDVFDVLAELPNASVGVIRAADFLEHIVDKVRLMNEIHRVLQHGGMLLSLTPSTDGRGAYQDPTHVSFWNSNSFWYYTDREFAKYVPEITARFQIGTLENVYPSDWHRTHQIPYVEARLIALHNGPRLGGFCNWG